MNQGRAAVRNICVPQLVAGGHHINRGRRVPGLHIVIGNNDDDGLRPAILQRIEHFADHAVGGRVALLGGIAFRSEVVTHRVGLIEVAKHEVDVVGTKRLQEFRQDGLVRRVSMSVEGGACRDGAVRRPSDVRRSGRQKAAIVPHDGCRANASGAAGIEESWHAWRFNPGPVRQPGVAPRGGADPVGSRIASGQKRAEAGVGG